MLIHPDGLHSKNSSMSDKFQDKYRIPSARAEWWDYSSNAAYFITIYTRGREHYFGEIVCETANNDVVETQNFASLRNHPYMNFTEIGEIACQCWKDIPLHFPFVRLDSFVVMPNHIHGIVIIDKKDQNVETQNVASLRNVEPYSKFGPQSKNLASIIRGYKSGVKKYATLNSVEFAWQSRFYDRIIRDEEECLHIVKYIESNPENWNTDQLNEAK
jgi:REP element-mobilizing transposase RayT